MVTRTRMAARGRTTQRAPLVVAIDTGGTFTDCVWSERGELRTLKVFSTPGDASQAILTGLRTIAENLQTDELLLLHGTTVGTNALLERKGARVALVTTVGFEDAIEIGRQARPKLYDFFFDRTPPLVESALRFGVDERTDAQGKLLCTPAESDLEELRAQVAACGAEAVAVCFLFSFANAHHEQLAAQALAPLGLPLSLSHQILPEFREYERMSTVCMNAYLQPLMARYLGNLRTQTATLAQRSRIFVMQSSGGITALATAVREPVRTVLSGPAGGVIGAAAAARRSGFDRIIAFDMGGTSTDVSLIDRVPAPSNTAEVAGLPVGVPMLDIHTVGAGGGSIARFDAAGALRVGPESAGADPGPICYGQGTEPTVTDANLLLGRLHPTFFLGGNFALDLKRTRSVTQQWLLAQRSNLTPEQFAAGVIRVVNATMEAAIRVVSIERGYDPREYALVAFGGAGPMHACELAAALNIPRVIVPAMPGALSAYGILVSDVVKDFSRTVLLRCQQASPLRRLESEWKKLEAAAIAAFRAEAWPGKPQLVRSADVRYRGQGFELNVPFGKNLLQDFHAEHQRRYGYSHPEREVEVVTVRVRSTLPGASSSGRNDSMTASPASSASPKRSGERHSERPRHPAGAPPWTVFHRTSLVPGKRYRGPGIITEYSATTVASAEELFYLDTAGNLILQTS